MLAELVAEFDLVTMNVAKERASLQSHLRRGSGAMGHGGVNHNHWQLLLVRLEGLRRLPFMRLFNVHRSPPCFRRVMALRTHVE